MTKAVAFVVRSILFFGLSIIFHLLSVQWLAIAYKGYVFFGLGCLVARMRGKVLCTRRWAQTCLHVVFGIYALFVLVVLFSPDYAITSLVTVWCFGVAVLNQYRLAVLRGDGRQVRDAFWKSLNAKGAG